MNISLIVIPEEPAEELSVRVKTIFPVETAQAATLLEAAGYEVKCLDLNLIQSGQWLPAVEDFILNSPPDILAFTPQFLTFNIRESYRIIGKVFKLVHQVMPNITTVIAGNIATSYPQRAKAETGADYILLGEFEFSLLRLVESLTNGEDIGLMPGLWKENLPCKSATVDNLSELPFPAYRTCHYERYFDKPERGNLRFPERSRRFTAYQATRGCPLRCSFCNVSFLRGKKMHWRRPVFQVLDHLERLVNEFGIEELHFIDENLTINQKYALALFDGMVERQLKLSWMPAGGIGVYTLNQELLETMRNAGCYRLTLAFESGSQEILKKYIGKPIRLEYDVPKLHLAKKMGFETVGYFVVGFPGETPQQRAETIALAEDPAFDYVVFSIATPQIGTRFARICNEKGLIDNKIDLTKLGKRSQGSFDGETFTRQELEELRVREWARINFNSPERVVKICHMMGIKEEEVNSIRESAIHAYMKRWGEI